MSDDDVQRALGRLDAHIESAEEFRKEFRRKAAEDRADHKELRDTQIDIQTCVHDLGGRVDRIEPVVADLAKSRLKMPLLAMIFGSGTAGGLVNYWAQIKHFLGGGPPGQ